MKYLLPILFLLSSCSYFQDLKKPSAYKIIKKEQPKKTVVIKNKKPQSIISLNKMSSIFSKNGWKKINSNQAQAFGLSRMNSYFLQGFESPNGSQIFMLKYKIPDSTPMSANDINSITDMSIFGKVFKLSKPASTRVVNHSNGTQVLHNSAIGNGNGKTLFIRRGIPTRFESAYIPLQFPNEKYSVLLVHFRGEVSDNKSYQQFNRYVDTVKLPQNVKPLL